MLTYLSQKKKKKKKNLSKGSNKPVQLRSTFMLPSQKLEGSTMRTLPSFFFDKVMNENTPLFDASRQDLQLKKFFFNSGQ
jgi:hypothetical protein